MVEICSRNLAMRRIRIVKRTNVGAPLRVIEILQIY